MNLSQLKKEFEERPLEFTAVATAAVIAVTKVVDVISSARSKNAYAKQVKAKARRKK
jgi:hypothetical protein